MKSRRFLIAATLVVFGTCTVISASLSARSQSTVPSSNIPFVGCASDGQVGPLPAPKGKPVRAQIPVEVATHLSYYKADSGFGALAPRGWHCFSTYGSNGSNLFVSLDPIKAEMFFSSTSSTWKGFGGEAIQVSVSDGGTSGRFAVASVIARVFPDRKEFVRDVIAEKFAPASAFPSGPYSGDKLIFRSKDTAEYETAPGAEGLGTHSYLQMTTVPIRGVVILFGEGPSLVQASLRISGERRGLVNTILEHLEHEVAAFGE